MLQAFSYHKFYIFTNMSKPLKINFSIPFTSIDYKISHSYNKLLLSSENVSKSPKHSYIINKKSS